MRCPHRLMVMLAACVVACAQDAPVSRSIEIPRVAAAPTLADFEGFRPVGTAAQSMARVNEFMARVPVNDLPVSERTEVYLGYDAANLYAVFLCFDRQPDRMRARLPNRDAIFEDDSITIQIDTFRDQQRAYSFGVNAGGIQGDGVWIEGRGWDLTFDAIYRSEVKRTDQGYIALLAIPFRSFRFPSGSTQRWGLILNRYIARTTEDAFWPRYSTTVQGRLNQMGEMNGLQEIASGRNVQFIPYVSFANGKDIDARDLSNVHFRDHDADVRAGLDTKLVIKDKLVLDATVNPDFSQVESDDPQVLANERFEVFFPEKRHFFIENASYFNTPVQLLFTRRLIKPTAGLRLTGKLGSNGIGILVSDDRAPGELLAPSDPDSGKHAIFSIARFAHDFGPQNFVGGIFTRRQFGDRENINTGADANWKLTPNLRAQVQGIASITRDRGSERQIGEGVYGGLFHEGDHFIGTAEYTQFSPEFQSDTGFVQRVDMRNIFSTGQYLFRPQHSAVVSWGSRLEETHTWDYNGQQLEQMLGSLFLLNMRRNTAIEVFYEFGTTTLRPIDFAALTANRDYDRRNWGGAISSTPSNLLSFNARFRRRRVVNFAPAAGFAPENASSLSGVFGVDLRPSRGLTISNTYLYTQLGAEHSDRSIFNNHVIRTRWLWQFDPRWSVRTTVQYDALLSNPQFTSLPRSRQLNGDFLVTYRVNHGTAVYVGYNHNVQNYDPRLLVSNGALVRDNTHLITDGRVFFVKLSYLFRY